MYRHVKFSQFFILLKHLLPPPLFFILFRAFHVLYLFSLRQAVIAITMPKECFWGRPCNCNECKPDLLEKCEICLDKEGDRVGSILTKDRKGIPYYKFKTYCRTCYHERIGQYEQEKFELFKAIVEEHIKNPPRQKYFEPMTEEAISERLSNGFGSNLKQIKFAQALTSDCKNIFFCQF